MPEIKIISADPVSTDEDGTQWFCITYSMDGVTKKEIYGFRDGRVINPNGKEVVVG